MGIVYRYYTPRPRQGRFVWRTYAPGTWSNPLTFAENEPFVNQPSIIYLGGGRYGVLYLSWETPFQRAAYFDVVGNETSTGIAETGNGKPEAFALEQNYPNPFNPSSSIKYTVTGARAQGSGISEVKLTVYDLLGREVAVLVNERKVPGSYEVSFDGSGLASGIYFYRLTAGSFVDTKKMVLVK
jgi:hypothetical protein